jgi:hypothetical protein
MTWHGGYMEHTKFRLGVQSYCFRTCKTMPKLVAAVDVSRIVCMGST